MAISAVFAQILAADRAAFNQRVVEARRTFPALDPEAFATFLQHEVDGVVQAVAAVAPELADQTAHTAYDMALELVGQALAGPKARDTTVNAVWRDLAPRCAPLIAVAPRAVLGALSNAAVQWSKMPQPRPPLPPPAQRWLEQMTHWAPQIDTVPGLLALGQLLAWRAGGLAHFRVGALHAAEQLPAGLALAVLGADTGRSWESVRDHILADPWWLPNAAERQSCLNGREIGAFSGLGGEFAEPPQLRALPDGFAVRSGGRDWHLLGDACGAVLLPASPDSFDQAPAASPHPAVAWTEQGLSVVSRPIDLDLPGDGLHWCCNTDSVAIGSPWTHTIRLVPLR